MNDQQLRKLADLCNKVAQAQPQMAGATAPGQAAAPPVQTTPPPDWEKHVDTLLQQPNLSQFAMPPWVWQLLIQVVQQLINNLSQPTLATAGAPNPPKQQNQP